MLSNASEYIGEPSLRIDVVQPGSLDQGVEDGSPLAATIGAAEQPGLPAEWHAAQRTFGGVVGQADPAVVEEAGEGIPAPQYVIDSLGEVVIARPADELGSQPRVKLSHQGRAQFAAHGEALVGGHAVDAALDIEQPIDPLHGLKCDQVDHTGMFAAALRFLRGC